jgi:hypothetical protein
MPPPELFIESPASRAKRGSPVALAKMMRDTVMKRVKLLSGVLILLILVSAACGSDGDHDQPVPRTATQPPTLTPEATESSPLDSLSAPSNGGLSLPELAGIDGGLLIARGGKLYLVWFGAEEPVLIAEEVAPVMIEPSPDGRAVVYAAGITEERTGGDGAPYKHFEYRLTVTDLTTLDSARLVAVGSERHMLATLLGWSPDSSTVLVWNNGAVIAANADGSDVQALAGARTVAWLPDNTALLFAPEDLLVSDSPLALFRVEPEFGQRERVNIPLDDTVPLDFLSLAGTLAARGMIYDRAAFHDFHRATPLPDGSWGYIEWSSAVKNMQTPPCATWTIKRTGGNTPPDMLYMAEATSFLSDLTALPDGSLLFLKWTLGGCRFGGPMAVELLHLITGQEPVMITGDIDPGEQTDLNRIGYWQARKYTVTPDGRYIFWIGKGDAEGVSLVNVTDLQDDITAPLLADVVLPEGTGRFADVFWVSRPSEEQ